MRYYSVSLDDVGEFIDFLCQRDSDRQLTRAAMATLEPALNNVWDNADDAEHDALSVHRSACRQAAPGCRRQQRCLQPVRSDIILMSVTSQVRARG
uniref:Uncharacterized protein n=1 Tax=Candidatus Kentrum sp. DK TaxID=2126562 RepID=A0A450SLY4_9GAMM|nr:MAG: hypothetical protein BECKDK2373C_GA0170839_100757 [Candidatus Kentron sp. DK]VFJ54701.1 MAG: hypothetical protein BECKDK2373B_GA0170837_104812 [Candidatus Kentron sp. DK]